MGARIVGRFSTVVYKYTNRSSSSSCSNIDPATIENRADALWWSDIVDSACNILFAANLRHSLTSGWNSGLSESLLYNNYSFVYS
jgi:hypothetical protein